MEKTGCKIIFGAPTTLAVKGLTMIMMIELDTTRLIPLVDLDTTRLIPLVDLDTARLIPSVALNTTRLIPLAALVQLARSHRWILTQFA